MSVARNRRVLVAAAIAVSAVLFAPAASPRPLSKALSFGFPAWSHDGKHIALVGQVGRGDSYLFVMNANGRNLRKIDTPGIDEGREGPEQVNVRPVTFPTWSPDDRRIAFSQGLQVASIWVIRSDGRGLRRLVRDGIAPSWSPGGLRIAYNDIPGETGAAAIHVVRPDGSDDDIAAQLSDAVQGPTWSPDGERLAFWLSRAPDGAEASGIGITHDYGARPRLLLSGHPVRGLAWSPSGREIAFVENGFISSLDLRTGRVKPLGYGASPSWSPDGKRIVFAAGLEGSIYIMSRDGSGVRLLLHGH